MSHARETTLTLFVKYLAPLIYLFSQNLVQAIIPILFEVI